MMEDAFDSITDGFMSVPCQVYPGKECQTHFEPCFMSHIAKKYWLKKVTEVVKPQVPRPKEYLSVYEVTLTSTKDDPYELRQWVNKIAQSAMYSVIDMPYCIELTKAGLPHVHAILYSKKKSIDASKIKKLGFPYRYECKRVKSLDNYENYIMKEKNNPIIIDYCTRKGIQQFDNAIQKEANV